MTRNTQTSLRTSSCQTPCEAVVKCVDDHEAATSLTEQHQVSCGEILLGILPQLSEGNPVCNRIYSLPPQFQRPGVLVQFGNMLRDSLQP